MLILRRFFLSRLKSCYKTSSADSFADPINASCDIEEDLCNISYSFRRAVEEYFVNQKPLDKDLFYSLDPVLLALLKVRLGKLADASKYLLKHLETNQSDFRVLMLLLRISAKLLDESTCRNNLSKAIDIIRSQEAFPKILKASFLSCISSICLAFGESARGLQLAEEAYSLIKDDLFQDSYGQISLILGGFYISRRRIKEAQEVFEKGFQAIKESVELNPRARNGVITSFLIYLSITYNIQHRTHEAINCAEESLALAHEVYGERHLQIAYILDVLGNYYISAGAFEKGVKYLQKALEIVKENCGEFHISTIGRCLNLQEILNQSDNRKGIISASYLEQAEKVGSRNPNILQAIAVGWMRIRRYKKAKKILFLAVNNAKEQKSPIDLLGSYGFLAEIYEKCGENLKALHYRQLCLDESRKMFDNKPNEEIIRSILEVVKFKILRLARGFVHDKITYKKEIIQHFCEAEEMCVKLSKTGNADELLAHMYVRRGLFDLEVNININEALSYFIKSLKLREELYGNENTTLIEPLKFICQAYLIIPEKNEEASSYFKRLLHLAEKFFGVHSSDYAAARMYCELYGDKLRAK